MSAVGAAAVGAATQVVGNAITGGSTGKQERANKRAAEHQFGLNEQAAQNAYDRQVEFFNLTNEYNTPAQQVKRLRDANLNPALLYGASAGGASGAASQPTAPQGKGTNTKEANVAEAKMVKIQEALARLQSAKLLSEVKVNEAKANKDNADAEQAGAQTETENKKRNAFVKLLEEQWNHEYEKGRGQYLKNAIERWKMDPAKSNDGYEHKEWDHRYGTANIHENGFLSRREADELAEIYAKAENNKALAELNTEKKRGYWQELLNATRHADADQQKAAAAKLAAEWSTGEHTNWKTWYDIANSVANAALGAVGK